MRVLLVLVIVPLGCARSVTWHLESAGIPRVEPISIVPTNGADRVVIGALDEALPELLAQDGAVVRHDAAWVVSVQIDDVVRCRDGWFPPIQATATARVTIRNGATVTDRFDVREVAPCKNWRRSGVESAARLGARLAERVTKVVSSRRR